MESTKKHLKNYTSFLFWSLATFFFGLQFIIRMSVGILREDIMAKYSIGMNEIGDLASVYYLGYSLAHIPIGIMLDKFNFKYIAFFSIFATFVGTILFGVADSWSIVLLSRSIIGCGSAAAILLCVKVTNVFFEEKNRSIMVGFSITFGLICAIFGYTPMKNIFRLAGYKETFIALSLLCLMLSIVVLFTKLDYKREENDLDAKKIIKVIFNPTILVVSILGGLMVGTLEGFADVWGIVLFKEKFGFSDGESMAFMSTIFFGMAIGGPLVGFMSQVLKRDIFLIFLTGVLTFIIYAFIFSIDQISSTTTYALMFIAGILCEYQILVFGIASSYINKKYITISIAIINSINMIFGSFFHKTIPLAIKFGQAKAQSSNDSLMIGISVVPIFCLLGSIGFLLIGVFIKKQVKKYGCIKI